MSVTDKKQAKEGSVEPALLGWREWVGLPELGIEWIKCKVDTGARTSALHAYFVERLKSNGRSLVRFKLHPVQRRTEVSQVCTAEIIDERVVTDSGGHRENRLVIATPLRIGTRTMPVEITLTERDDMRFRMLLGRTAINGNFIVDPSRSYVTGKPPRDWVRAMRKLSRQ